ncbi:hypothetical protein M5X04_26825 [Paenibacillus alvei]|uniref:Sigma-70 family RNA polymerase sigma factor n=1 Tax=Paenibacillus alvei TaxID=44250 RepID=A0ABT4EGQ4_PAEAL|nr:hypothetical protein [Paenibacillus alvei]MCY9532927.1 hypothetical protein [Paenibacillus alvei]
MNSENLIYEDVVKRYLPEINKLSYSLWYKVRDETVFQKICYDSLKRAVTKCDPSKGSFDSLARKSIWNARAWVLKRRQVPWEKFDPLDKDRVDEGISIILEDDLAVVDDALMVNERIASLAGDDSRRRFVLKAWSEGFYNESELATLLAQRYGGNARSHCKFIQRFKTECREKLDQIA